MYTFKRRHSGQKRSERTMMTLNSIISKRIFDDLVIQVFVTRSNKESASNMWAAIEMIVTTTCMTAILFQMVCFTIDDGKNDKPESQNGGDCEGKTDFGVISLSEKLEENRSLNHEFGYKPAVERVQKKESYGL